MNYGLIRYNDIANGPGCRTSLFVSGCDVCCLGCFNTVAWDFDYGKPFTENETTALIKSCESPFISGLSILGGEPFAERNRESVRELCSAFRRNLPHKSIWIYSGHLFEQLIEDQTSLDILKMVDVLVDGPFMQEEHDITLRFRGSRNQRIIDTKRSLMDGAVVCWVDDEIFSSHGLVRER